jgi:hypothetical protein
LQDLLTKTHEEYINSKDTRSFADYLSNSIAENPSGSTNSKDLYTQLLNLPPTTTQKPINWTGIRPFYREGMMPIPVINTTLP